MSAGGTAGEVVRELLRPVSPFCNGREILFFQRRRFGILLPLRQTVIAVGGQAGPLLPSAVGPYHGQPIDLGCPVQPEDVPAIAGGGVAAAALGEARLPAAVRFED